MIITAQEKDLIMSMMKSMVKEGEVTGDGH